MTSSLKACICSSIWVRSAVVNLIIIVVTTGAGQCGNVSGALFG